MNFLPGWFPMADSGILPLDLTYHASAASETDASSYNHGTLSFGAPYVGRYVIVGAYTDTTNITGISIGGVAGTEMVYNDSGATAEFALYYRLIETGTDGNVTVTLAGTAARGGVGVWTARLQGLTPVDTLAPTANVDPMTGNIDVSAGGGLIGLYASHSAGGAVAWSGLTLNFDIAVSASRNFSGASITDLAAEANRAITCNPTSTSDVACFIVSLR